MNQRHLFLSRRGFMLAAISLAMSGCAQTTYKTLPSLTGRWEIGMLDAAGKNWRSDVVMKREGGKITGQGTDRTGRFLIDGDYAYPKIRLRKTYVDAQLQALTDSKSCEMDGAIDWANPDSTSNPIPYKVHMYGTWFPIDASAGKVKTTATRWEAGMMFSDAVLPAGKK
jgi:hypothetical protein